MRERIYKRLGLPVGSLKSESGRDWNEALKEIEDEDKKHSSFEINMSNEAVAQRLRHKLEADKINESWSCS